MSAKKILMRTTLIKEYTVAEVQKDGSMNIGTFISKEYLDADGKTKGKPEVICTGEVRATFQEVVSYLSPHRFIDFKQLFGRP